MCEKYDVEHIFEQIQHKINVVGVISKYTQKMELQNPIDDIHKRKYISFFPYIRLRLWCGIVDGV